MASKLTRNYLPELIALGLRRKRPGMVTVNLTDKCNQHCIYCEIGKGIPTASEKRLTVDDLKWIVDEMEIMGIKKISLCGGEPFLFTGIVDVVKYAAAKKVRCSITSNGMTIHKLSSSEFAILKQCGTEVNISIDSFDNEIQTLTRGSELALKNAISAVQILTQHSIPVTVLTCITKYNFLTLFEFITIASRMGIKQVLFQPVIVYSNYADRTVISEKPNLNVPVDELGLLIQQLEKIIHFERMNKVETNVYRILPWISHYIVAAANPQNSWFFNKVLKKFYCREIDAIIDITYDGGIQPCGLALASIDIFGNREKGLRQLWEQATVGIRKDLNAGRYHPYCNGCCHHFSRNMLASLLKYPGQNRQTISIMVPLLMKRIISRMYKQVFALIKSHQQ